MKKDMGDKRDDSDMDEMDVKDSVQKKIDEIRKRGKKLDIGECQ